MTHPEGTVLAQGFAIAVVVAGCPAYNRSNGWVTLLLVGDSYSEPIGYHLEYEPDVERLRQWRRIGFCGNVRALLGIDAPRGRA
ncbi:MAG: hypothetical protein HOW73_44950 [Polyangiaceae bacterium]|nr:hypothetical protein [Polyangiaceae bacterium]